MSRYPGGSLLTGYDSSGSRCTTLQVVQLYVWPHTRSCTSLDLASLTRVVLLEFYLLLVMFPCQSAVEVREEGVLIPPGWVVISEGVSD